MAPLLVNEFPISAGLGLAHSSPMQTRSQTGADGAVASRGRPGNMEIGSVLNSQFIGAGAQGSTDGPEQKAPPLVPPLPIAARTMRTVDPVTAPGADVAARSTALGGEQPDSEA